MTGVTGMERFTQAFWDERYSGHAHVWSGRPNIQLVAYTGNLPPGRALDVGCGEGADVVWLAERGWQVTGADVSPVGLARAAAHAEAAGPGVAARTAWRHVDLFAADDEFEPFEPEFELVSSHYLHLPVALRDAALARLAAGVAPGGHLLLVAHHPLDLQIPGLRPPEPDFFCEATELAERLERVDPGSWTILATDAPAREEHGHGHAAERVVVHDAVLLARRESPVGG